MLYLRVQGPRQVQKWVSVLSRLSISDYVARTLPVRGPRPGGNRFSVGVLTHAHTIDQQKINSLDLQYCIPFGILKVGQNHADSDSIGYLLSILEPLAHANALGNVTVAH